MQKIIGLMSTSLIYYRARCCCSQEYLQSMIDSELIGYFKVIIRSYLLIYSSLQQVGNDGISLSVDLNNRSSFFHLHERIKKGCSSTVVVDDI